MDRENAIRVTRIREQWKSPKDFLIVIFSTYGALSTTNILPLHCIKYGGAALLLIYLTFAVLLGIPVCFLQLLVGQYNGRPLLYIYKNLAPAWIGIGILHFFCCFLSSLNQLVRISHMSLCLIETAFGDEHFFCIEGVECTNSTKRYDVNAYLRSPIFHNDTESYLNLDWELLLCYIGVLVPRTMIMMSGMRTVGRAALILLLVPAVIVMIFVVQAFVTPGGLQGIQMIFICQWHRVLSAEVWYMVFRMVSMVYELALGIGTEYAANNYIHVDIYTIMPCLIFIPLIKGIMGCCLTYSALGVYYFKDNHSLTQKDLDAVTEDFLYVILRTIFMYPTRRVFAGLLFVQQMTLCAAYLVSIDQVMRSNVLYTFPKLSKMKLGMISLGIYLCTGVFFCSKKGKIALEYYTDIIKWSIEKIVGFLQLIVLIYIYGLRNCVWITDYVVRKKINFLYRVSWAILYPAFYVFLYAHLMYVWYTDSDIKKTVIEISITAIGLATFFLFVLIAMNKYRKSPKGCKAAFSSENFLPLDPAIAQRVLIFFQKKSEREVHKTDSKFLQFWYALIYRTK